VEARSIKTGSIEKEAGALSGGNQQKVVLAKCLAVNPEVLIVDEPTRGIDIASKIEIYSLLRNFAERGGAVVLISSELSEILGLSDRVVVFRSGRITGELTGTITEKGVVDLMFQHSKEKSPA
jgi:ribose transport system ATP-binding protein